MGITKRVKNMWLGRLWRERRLLVILAAVLIIELPIFVLLAQRHDAGHSPLTMARRAAQTATEDGNYTVAYDILEAELGAAKTKSEKLALYNDLAAAAANSGKPDLAIDYLRRRHELDPKTTEPDAYMLATLYENTGDAANALTQYKLARLYYKSLDKSPTNEARIEGVEVVIADLEAAQ